MQNSAENDERVMTLAAAALHMPAAERAEFLRVACKDQPGLHAEVVDVVEWEERMGDFLRQPLINFIDLEEQETPEKLFQPGVAISDRFLIMREVGQGGMGVVYEAFDRKRNQRVAIKCAKPGFGRLLSPELEGALKVRHHNICLVNEIHTAATVYGELDFLTMEFLEGETLSARLARDGNLSSEEALDIARQLCAGLAAAHQAGILHRDLKTANVFLTQTEEGKMRAVITDFGLATEARLESDLDGGTPRYMAPELWRGEKPSKASDVYALAVILYEMVTGQPPCKGEAGADQKPITPPRLPSSFNCDVDARWDKAIFACLETSPTARPEAADILDIFDKRPLWKSPILAVAVLVIFALLAAFQQPLLSLFKPADIRLAILPPDASGDLVELGNGVLQDVGERVKATAPKRSTLVIIPVQESLHSNLKSADDAGEVLRATHALEMKISKSADTISVDAAIVETATQTHSRDFYGTYALKDAGNIAGALTGFIRLGLRLPWNSDEHISPAATPVYEQGLYLLHRDRDSFEAAAAAFQQAALLDPQSPLPFAGLAEAQLLKYERTQERQSLDSARRALDSAEALNPASVRVRLAAGLLNEEQGRYEKALEEYLGIEESAPRNVDAFLRAGRVYETQDLPERAIESYRKAIALDPAYYWPHEWLGAFFYFHGRYSEAAEEFQREIQLAPGHVDAYNNLGAVMSDLGRYADAEKALRSSLQFKQSAAAFNNLGAALAYQHKDDEATQYYEHAAALQPGEYLYWLNLADSLRRLSRSQDARTAYKKARDLAAVQLMENPHNGYKRAYVAYLKARLGERAGALEDIGQALNSSAGENKVIRYAVLTFVALGETKRAEEILSAATPEVLRELSRHPDLVDFSRNREFQELLAKAK